MEQLRKFAYRSADSVKAGDVVGLVGELGAGKTTFAQIFAERLGVKEAVKSPTFIIMQVFDTGAPAARRGIRKLCHADAYRLEGSRELFGVGFEDYAGRDDTVTLVEWADRVPEIHRMGGYKELTFEFTPEGGRKVITDKH